MSFAELFRNPLLRLEPKPLCLLLASTYLLSGCGGFAPAATSTSGNSPVLADSNGKALSNGSIVAANHALESAIGGFGPHDQAAYLFTGPAGTPSTPPYGLPACSYFTILSLDQNGSLPPTVVCPKLPAGSYTCAIYDLSGHGAARKGTLRYNFSFTASNNAPGVPSLGVGTVSGATFTLGDSFVPAANLYVQGTGLPAGKTVSVYCVAHKFSWAAGDNLVDVTNTITNSDPNLPPGTRTAPQKRELLGTAKTVTISSAGVLAQTLLWQDVPAEADQQTFDVIVDVNRSGQFDPQHDYVLDQATGSFVIDSINRGGSNNVTLAYDVNMVPSAQFSTISPVKTRLTPRTVNNSRPYAAVYIVKHQDTWTDGEFLTDVSGPGGTENYQTFPIVNHQLVIPPCVEYQPDLQAGNYDMIVSIADPVDGKYSSATDLIDSGVGRSSFTVSGTPAQKKWTVMVYLDGNNSLSSFAISNFIAMEKVNYLKPDGTSDVNVVVQYADSGANTNRYIVAHSTNSTKITTEPLQQLGTVDMGNPATLGQFIAWAKTVSPADHYALILWDHGSGFESRTTLPSRNLCWADSFNKDSLTVEQAHDVIKNNGPFDLVACDCCLMGMTEVAYEFRDLCSYYVASEDLEPGNGYDYATFLNSLVANPAMSAKDLGSAIVSSYGNYYTTNTGLAPSWTLSCIDESAVADAATGLGNIAAALADSSKGPSLLDQDPTLRDKILNATFQRFQKPTSYEVADASDVATQIATKTNNAGLQSACQAEVAAVSAAVVAERHASVLPNSHGLTVWFPTDQATYDNLKDEYSNLQFSKDTKWPELLKKLFIGTGTVPVSISFFEYPTQPFQDPSTTGNVVGLYTFHVEPGVTKYSIRTPQGTSGATCTLDTSQNIPVASTFFELEGLYFNPNPDPGFTYKITGRADGYFFNLGGGEIGYQTIEYWPIPQGSNPIITTIPQMESYVGNYLGQFVPTVTALSSG